jgi:hypothetical protein
MSNTATKKNSVKGVIDERKVEETYRLIDINEEMFTQTGEQIIRACKMHIGIEVWVSNFTKTIEQVTQWAEQLKDKIAQVLVEPRSDKIIFFITPRGEQYDFDLGFKMADLDVILNTQCNIGYAETRQIPSWDHSTFVSDRARLIWPQQA